MAKAHGGSMRGMYLHVVFLLDHELVVLILWIGIHVVVPVAHCRRGAIRRWLLVPKPRLKLGQQQSSTATTSHVQMGSNVKDRVRDTAAKNGLARYCCLLKKKKQLAR
jgi:hypothetical protein